ncbi:MAG: helix-turn-helix transcriptional regulator [Erysipelotrichaceae bacterium]|nr:helix-turn-helix transcriptional regulator [Erysipelotrichaceae bacterium]
MAKVEDCPGFETFGADVKATREKLGISRRELAAKIGVDPRYLANIELKATIPSMPLVVQLFHLCNLPAEKYFNPVLWQEETELCQRVKYKVQLCPDKYLPAIESTGANAVNTVLADMDQPLCGVVPVVRQGQHQGKQSLCF